MSSSDYDTDEIDINESDDDDERDEDGKSEDDADGYSRYVSNEEESNESDEYKGRDGSVEGDRSDDDDESDESYEDSYIEDDDDIDESGEYESEDENKFKKIGELGTYQQRQDHEENDYTAAAQAVPRKMGDEAQQQQQPPQPNGARQREERRARLAQVIEHLATEYGSGYARSRAIVHRRRFQGHLDEIEADTRQVEDTRDARVPADELVRRIDELMGGAGHSRARRRFVNYIARSVRRRVLGDLYEFFDERNGLRPNDPYARTVSRRYVQVLRARGETPGREEEGEEEEARGRRQVSKDARAQAGSSRQRCRWSEPAHRGDRRRGGGLRPVARPALLSGHPEAAAGPGLSAARRVSRHHRDGDAAAGRASRLRGQMRQSQIPADAGVGRRDGPMGRRPPGEAGGGQAARAGDGLPEATQGPRGEGGEDGAGAPAGAAGSGGGLGPGRQRRRGEGGRRRRGGRRRGTAEAALRRCAEGGRRGVRQAHDDLRRRRRRRRPRGRSRGRRGRVQHTRGRRPVPDGRGGRLPQEVRGGAGRDLRRARRLPDRRGQLPVRAAREEQAQRSALRHLRQDHRGAVLRPGARATGAAGTARGRQAAQGHLREVRGHTRRREEGHTEAGLEAARPVERRHGQDRRLAVAQARLADQAGLGRAPGRGRVQGDPTLEPGHRATGRRGRELVQLDRAGGTGGLGAEATPARRVLPLDGRRAEDVHALQEGLPGDAARAASQRHDAEGPRSRQDRREEAAAARVGRDFCGLQHARRRRWLQQRLLTTRCRIVEIKKDNNREKHEKKKIVKKVRKHYARRKKKIVKSSPIGNAELRETQ
ncbi:unnamed protein product [Trichogramma brassicae]|uniref:Uncharacterized protein n=1 Tax=Trichogramma brassicae TaxID=86971 RepID=A0A6H5I5Q0_9HYME|nr:unnamed protein product [Trichogramma brassicae]